MQAEIEQGRLVAVPLRAPELRIVFQCYNLVILLDIRKGISP
jgi:hypothetical protein